MSDGNAFEPVVLNVGRREGRGASWAELSKSADLVRVCHHRGSGAVLLVATAQRSGMLSNSL